MLFYDIPKITGSERLHFDQGQFIAGDWDENEERKWNRRLDEIWQVRRSLWRVPLRATSLQRLDFWSKIQFTHTPCSFKDLCISMVNMVHVCPCSILDSYVTSLESCEIETVRHVCSRSTWPTAVTLHRLLQLRIRLCPCSSRGVEEKKSHKKFLMATPNASKDVTFGFVDNILEDTTKIPSE